MKTFTQAGLVILLVVAVGAGFWLNRMTWRHRGLVWQLQAAVVAGGVGFVAGRLTAGKGLMTDPAIPSPEEPMKLRALTYTEMMNGGRQQMDEAEHVREQQLQQRVEDLEKDVDWLEKSLKGGIESAST